MYIFNFARSKNQKNNNPLVNIETGTNSVRRERERSRQEGILIILEDSGILLGSLGQYIGFPEEWVLQSLSAIARYSSLPLELISLDPQAECFALKSPATMNLGSTGPQV